jgi:HD-GYP domain-containing protein (c-di-GMP phosphodiesterase class II)
MEMIRSHPVEAYEILQKNSSMEGCRKIIIQHHERINGSGYPEGIKGDEILIEAKILSVADVVEAMTSHRPYRPALGLKAALEEIMKNKGILYDVRVVDSCLNVFSKKKFKF